MSKEKERKLKVLQLIRDVRKKYSSIKQGRSEQDATMQRLYRPITEQLDRMNERNELIPMKTANLTAMLSKKLKYEPDTAKESMFTFDLDPQIIEPIPHTYKTKPSKQITRGLKNRISSFFARNPTESSTPKSSKEIEMPSPFTPKKLFERIKPPYYEGKEENEDEVGFLPTHVIAETVEEDQDEGEEADEKNESAFMGDKNESRKFIEEITKGNAVSQYFDQYPPQVRNYVYTALTNPANYDHTYGPKYEQEVSKWRLGDTVINFNQKTGGVQVNRIKFEGTAGLYDLIFNSEPKNYDEKDLQNYKKILELTNVHRRDYKASGQLKGNSGFKYRYVIQKLFEKKTGKGFMKYNEKPVEYRYWDQVGELIQRLKLLIASRQAGNNSNENEINAIIEELREAKVIY